MSACNCNQHGCFNSAFYRFTWPGKDEQFICTEHVSKLQAIADALGMHIQIRPIEDVEKKT